LNLEVSLWFYDLFLLDKIDNWRTIQLLFLLLSNNATKKCEILNTLLIMTSILDLLSLSFLRRVLFLEIFRFLRYTHRPIQISNPLHEFLIRNSLRLNSLLLLWDNHQSILMNRSNIFIISPYSISFRLFNLFRAHRIFLLNHLLENKIAILTLEHPLIDLLLFLLFLLSS
jgi:hypothetical protein